MRIRKGTARRSDLQAACDDLRRSVRVQSQFGSGPGSLYPRKLYRRNSSWRPPAADPVAETEIDFFERRLFRHFDERLDNGSLNDLCHGNFNRIDDLGIRLMRQGYVSAVCADKDNSFVLISESSKRTELYRIVSNGLQWVATPDPDTLFQDVLNRYLRIARRIASAVPFGPFRANDGPRLLRFLLHKLGATVWEDLDFAIGPGPFRPVNSLEFTLKTHKSPITPREIEGGTSNFLQPGANLESTILRPILEQTCPWVARDSKSVLREFEIGDLRVPPGYCLIAVDIKQFYPSCHQDELRSNYSAMMDSELRYPPQARKALCELNSLLLNSQFATSPHLDSTYRRVQGIGMGHGSAAEQCDLYVARNHDRIFLDGIAKGDILWYRRFRDDGLACVPEEVCTEDWFDDLVSKFSSAGSSLRLELTRSHGSSIVWLDLFLRWGPDLGPQFSGGRVCVSCWIKPTNLGLYVPADSGHSLSVRRTWPQAEFRRLIRNSMRLQDVWEPVRRLRRCLRDRLYPVGISMSLSDADIIGLWHCRRRLFTKPAQQFRDGVLPFKMPYHPVWDRISLSARLNQLCDALKTAISRSFRPIVCFENPGRHLHIAVRNYSSRRTGEEEGG